MLNQKLFASILVGVVGILVATLPASARPGRIAGVESGTLVNMRSSPNINDRVVNGGLVGESITVLQETSGQDGYIWYRIRNKSGTVGWIRGDYVSMNRACRMFATLMADRPGERINVRSAPTTRSDIRTSGIHGDHVRILRNTQGGDAYNWYYIRHTSGTEGWVRGDLVKFG